MYEEELRIPKRRIAVLIGEKGATKRKLEKHTYTRIEVDSEEGNIRIFGEDNFKIFITKNIVRAIGRGFNPVIAMKLVSENTYFENINIADFAGKSKKKLYRLRSRVIGTKGKSRMTIERITNTKISIYGKTVCIIGGEEDIRLARRAVEMLLQGSPHGNVYKYLQKQRQNNKI